MKLSTRGIYGLTAMVDLAVHDTGNVIPIKSISERQKISENYLEQLFAVLKKAGLVKSERGSQGGYMLAGSPGEITVGRILKTLEGSLAPVGCVAENSPISCRRSGDCITRVVWERIRDGLNCAVDSITLEDLMEAYYIQNEDGNNMYYI